MAVDSGNLNEAKAMDHRVAKLIIILHEDGYIHDFFLLEDRRIHCIQEPTVHAFDEVNINRLGICGGSPEKLLIAIETADGLKGILHTVLCIKCFDLLNKEKLLSKKRLINGDRLKLLVNE